MIIGRLLKTGLMLLTNIALTFGQPYEMTVNPPTNESIARLSVYHHKGALAVNGYNGDVIFVKAGNKTQDLKYNRQLAGEIKVGTRGTTLEFNAQVIEASLDLEIFVPMDISISVLKSESGKVEIQNINGLVEVENPYGDIHLRHISGAGVVSSTDGNLWIQFSGVEPNTPMSFATFEGNIELSLPESSKNTLNIKTEQGTIDNQLQDKNSGIFLISRSTENRFSLNGGGAEIYLQSYSGNITVKKTAGK